MGFKKWLISNKEYITICFAIIGILVGCVIFIYFLVITAESYNKITIDNHRNDLTINIPTNYYVVNYDMIEEDDNLKVTINYKYKEEK